MKKIGLAFVLVATLGVGTIATARAMPAVSSAQLGAAAEGFNMVEKTQYIYGGRRYCWYGNGWRGPGWYWCGYAFRQGFGWGGGIGWHGWRGGRLHGGGYHGGGRRGGHHHH